MSHLRWVELLLTRTGYSSVVELPSWNFWKIKKYFLGDSCWCAVSNGGSKPFEKFMKGE
jgi:hypothetical protein